MCTSVSEYAFIIANSTDLKVNAANNPPTLSGVSIIKGFIPHYQTSSIKTHSQTLRGAMLTYTIINSHSQVSDPGPKGPHV